MFFYIKPSHDMRSNEAIYLVYEYMYIPDKAWFVTIYHFLVTCSLLHAVYNRVPQPQHHLRLYRALDID